MKRRLLAALNAVGYWYVVLCVLWGTLSLLCWLFPSVDWATLPWGFNYNGE